jgi:hypothetical protein
MVTFEEFWRIMAAYGASIFPAQWILYVCAVLISIWLLWKPSRFRDLAIKSYLSLVFAWNGIVFYMIPGRDMAGGSLGNWIGGGLFLVVSVLLAIDIALGKMKFALPTAGPRRFATPALILLVLLYPIFGVAFGRSFSALIIPGSHPCPTIAFALLLLTTALPKVNVFVFIILLLLGIPMTPFFQIARYGVWEDLILVVVGLFGLFSLLKDLVFEKRTRTGDASLR